MTAPRIDHTDAHVHLSFPRPARVLSSAVLGGGFSNASHIVNLRVDENFHGDKQFGAPDEALAAYARLQGWAGVVVGMMTAASMKSLRACTLENRELSVTALTTSGLSNARCAGDPADCGETAPPGTINIVLLTNARLEDAAMVEAVQVTTEAKSAVLRDLGILSRTTGRPATGTGTDSLAVVSGEGPLARYCGKHLPLGELMARAVIRSLEESLQWHLSR